MASQYDPKWLKAMLNKVQSGEPITDEEALAYMEEGLDDGPLSEEKVQNLVSAVRAHAFYEFREVCEAKVKRGEALTDKEAEVYCALVPAPSVSEEEFSEILERLWSRAEREGWVRELEGSSPQS